MSIASKMFVIPLVFFLLLGIICNSFSFKSKSFSEIEIGERFGLNRDGYEMKIADNYCLCVDLGSVTKLIKVPDNRLDTDFYGDENNRPLYLEKAILEGHYIEGYYNDEYLVLWEEKETENSFLSFNFQTKQIDHYENVESVYEKFGFSDDDWFSLCNTYEQMI